MEELYETALLPVYCFHLSEDNMVSIGRMAMRIIAAATMDDYSKLRRDRDEIISLNRSRRMKGKPPLPVPPKPEQPMGFDIYIGGEWEGFFPQDDRGEAIAEGQEHANGGKVTVKRRPRTH